MTDRPRASLASAPPRAERGETPEQRRWEQATATPLMIAAFVFLTVYTVRAIGDLTRGPSGLVAVGIMLACWLFFIVDYVVRLALARPRGRWVWHHLFDLVVVVVPTLRAIRLLRALTLVTSFTRTAGTSLRARLLVYGIAAALLLIWQASLLVLDVERHAPGASIRSFGDAIWWAFCTVTTVGYGDFTPVTLPGRTVAVLLMVGGVVLVGLITATFSSWVLERATRGHQEEQGATRADIERVLTALGAGGDAPGAGPSGPGPQQPPAA